jgi:two-component system cell cycle response regulator
MRVALVDPSRTMRMYVTRLLQARDHEVRLFADGSEALACVRTDSGVDAVITSMELGQMSGLELCWETRVLAGRDRPIYVILMSSNLDKKRLGEALDSGADDFISKPPVPDELYARLRAAERLTTMQRELVRFASFDPLTGVYNRRVFFEIAQGATQRTSTIASIMLDIDHFKRVNDVFGHDVGDRAIRAVAQAANTDGAVVGRLGGEEFAVLLEGRTLEQGLAMAESVRTRVAALHFETPKGPMALTCSFGVSERTPDENIDEMLKRADVALYAAKTGGRNRVVAADPAPADSFCRPGTVIRTRAG